jgi:hypothetical protein
VHTKKNNFTLAARIWTTTLARPLVRTKQKTETMNQSPSALPFFVLEPATHGREKSEVRKKENEDPEPQIELNPKSAPGGVLAGKIKNLTGARWRGALARLTENRIRGRLIPNAAEKELRSSEKPRTCEPTAATMGDPWEGNSRRRRLRGESRTRLSKKTGAKTLAPLKTEQEPTKNHSA